MTIFLECGNVVKCVSSEDKAMELVSRGFVIVKRESDGTDADSFSCAEDEFANESPSNEADKAADDSLSNEADKSEDDSLSNQADKSADNNLPDQSDKPESVKASKTKKS